MSWLEELGRFKGYTIVYSDEWAREKRMPIMKFWTGHDGLDYQRSVGNAWSFMEELARRQGLSVEELMDKLASAGEAEDEKVIYMVKRCGVEVKITIRRARIKLDGATLFVESWRDDRGKLTELWLTVW